jgi:hypothetical protein
VIAEYPRVHRHDQAVVDTHPRHLQQHVRAEGSPVGRIGPPGDHRLEEDFGVGRLQFDRQRFFDAVIGGHRAVPDEVLAAALQRGQVTSKGGAQSRLIEQRSRRLAEADRVGVEVPIRPERRRDATAEPHSSQSVMRDEVVKRIIRGRQELDPEATKQGTRTERGRGELLGNRVVERVG